MRPGDRSSKRSQVAMTAITLLLLSVSLIYSRTYTPAWPGDFAAYLGAGAALASGANPYNDSVVSRCLAELGQGEMENLPYLYSPAFALPFSSVKYIGAVWVRRIWFMTIHASFWLGFFLLFSEKEPPLKRLILLAATGTALLFTGPYRSAVQWGQATPLLFLLASIALKHRGKAFLSSASLSLIPFVKPALMLPVLQLKGRSWLYLAGSIMLITGTSMLFTGLEPWEQYIRGIESVSAEWDLGIPGNRSLAGNVYRAMAHVTDRYMREVSNDHAGRIERAVKLRNLSNGICLVIAVGCMYLFFREAGVSAMRRLYDSELFAPLLCWLSPVISPLAYDHYGLFLLPLLIHTILHSPSRQILAVVVSAFVYWAVIPSWNTLVQDELFFIVLESLRPAMLLLTVYLIVRDAASSSPRGEWLRPGKRSGM